MFVKKVALVVLAIGVGSVGVAWYLKKSALDYALEKIVKLEGMNSSSCHVERLLGGSGAKVYKVICGSHKYVVRIIEKNDLACRVREMKIQNMCAQVGCAPQIYAFDKDRGYIVMEYIDKAKEASSHYSLKEVIVMHIQALKKLHALPYEGLRKVRFLEKMQEEVESARNTLKNCGIDLAQIDAMAKRINQEDTVKFTQGLCHADLNPENVFVKDGSKVFIDFESSGQGDIFIDLGVSFAYGFMDDYLGRIPFTQNDVQFALETYFDRPLSPQEDLHLKVMIMAALLKYGCTEIKLEGLKHQEEARAFLAVASNIFDEIQTQQIGM